MGVANGTIDSVELYRVGPNGVLQHYYDLSNKYKGRSAIFKVDLPPGEAATFIVKIRSAKPLIVPLYISGNDGALKTILYDNVAFSLYLGIVLVMFFYNIFIYITTRDKNYFYYILYIVFLVLTQVCLQGYVRMFDGQANSYMARISIPFCTALIGYISGYFIRNFLNLKENMRWFDKAITWFNLVYFIAMGLSLANYVIPAQIVVQCNTLTGSIITLYAGIALQRRGFKSAFFFNISWSFFLLSVIVFIMKDVGVLPFNWFTNNSILFGSSIETALLSFALADKINTYRKEKEESQAEALRASEENERIIREQNQVLEVRVTERTLELKESNEQLNDTLVELKDAQAKMVESEKMASLGQLTAGIAHEINNPINFVSSNVTPLQRDIQLLDDAFMQIEQLALSDLEVGEKQKQIAALKEEIEYDYLKEEIDFLLKGIADGSKRTAEIVKGLRVFSRIDEEDFKTVNVHEGIDATLVIINTLLSSHITVVKEYGDVPPIECYPGKLNQVFLNIFTNAIHAIEKKWGGKSGGILRITSACEGNILTIKINDNGLGMNDETTKHIFEPFFTTKDVGEGTGLGLSIVYNIIKKHNGNIHVESVEGEYTTFTIDLPINI